MANRNSVELMGKVYSMKSIERKSGKTMVVFSLLTFSYQGKEKEDKAQFHKLVAYDSRADVLLKYASVDGRELFVEGTIDYYKDEKEVVRTQIIVNSFEFIDGKKPEAVA